VRPWRDRPQAPKVDPTRRQQGHYLRRLGQVIVATYGAEAECTLRWQEKLPLLPYLLVCGVPVWAVSTSTGWRFLWNRYRSHPVTDLSGAARALMTDLGPPRTATGKGAGDSKQGDSKQGDGKQGDGNQTVNGAGPAAESDPPGPEGSQAEA
jgi:hypothetical protein